MDKLKLFFWDIACLVDGVFHIIWRLLPDPCFLDKFFGEYCQYVWHKWAEIDRRVNPQKWNSLKGNK